MHFKMQVHCLKVLFFFFLFCLCGQKSLRSSSSFVDRIIFFISLIVFFFSFSLCVLVCSTVCGLNPGLTYTF